MRIGKGISVISQRTGCNCNYGIFYFFIFKRKVSSFIIIIIKIKLMTFPKFGYILTN